MKSIVGLGAADHTCIRCNGTRVEQAYSYETNEPGYKDGYKTCTWCNGTGIAKSMPSAVVRMTISS